MLCNVENKSVNNDDELNKFSHELACIKYGTKLHHGRYDDCPNETDAKAKEAGCKALATLATGGNWYHQKKKKNNTDTSSASNEKD